MVSKIKKIWKNKWLILEGMFNYYFTRKKIEKIASYRNDICSTCPLIDLKGDKCEVPGTHPCCGDCGCSLKYKTYSMSSECPQGNWFAVMSEEEEDDITARLEANEKLSPIDELVEELVEIPVDARTLFKPTILKQINDKVYTQEDYNLNLDITDELLDEPNLCDKACFFKNYELVEYYETMNATKIAKGSIYDEGDYGKLINDAADIIQSALDKNNVCNIYGRWKQTIYELYQYDHSLFKFWFKKYRPSIGFFLMHSYENDTCEVFIKFYSRENDFKTISYKIPYNK